MISACSRCAPEAEKNGRRPLDVVMTGLAPASVTPLGSYTPASDAPFALSSVRYPALATRHRAAACIALKPRRRLTYRPWRR
jgi:hypothetical protein